MPEKRILIVDDEKEHCDFFTEYLTSRGYSLDVAYDGLNAKYLLECNIYDVIFFDCNMPELSGVELIKIIREKNPEAKAVMISGYELINEDFAKDLKVDKFLSKPVSLQKLREIIENG